MLYSWRTFIVLILISCDSLALSSQTSFFYIDKKLISDWLQTATSCSNAMRVTNWAICLLIVHRNYSVTWSYKWSELKYLYLVSYFSIINYSLFRTANCFPFKVILNWCSALLLGHEQNASAGISEAWSHRSHRSQIERRGI